MYKKPVGWGTIVAWRSPNCSMEWFGSDEYAEREHAVKPYPEETSLSVFGPRAIVARNTAGVESL